MERVIKYRGKGISNNQWYYGSLCQELDSYYICHNLGSEIWYTEVDKKSIGQFTGLYDNECREVYEGDTIQFVACPSITAKVCWNQARAAFTLKLHYQEEPGTLSLGAWIADGNFFRVLEDGAVPV